MVGWIVGAGILILGCALVAIVVAVREETRARLHPAPGMPRRGRAVVRLEKPPVFTWQETPGWRERGGGRDPLRSLARPLSSDVPVVPKDRDHFVRDQLRSGHVEVNPVGFPDKRGLPTNRDVVGVPAAKGDRA